MKRRYFIFGPQWWHRSGGLVALYNLQKAIIRKGFDCFYYSYSDLGVARREVVEEDVVIYPEVVIGNPLGASRVVRWILNLPGVMGGNGVYSNTDFIYSYLPRFDVPGRRGYLFIPNWDDELKDLGLPRKGSLIWVHKGAWKKRIPLEGVEITETSTSSKRALIDLLQRSEVLYSYDDCTVLALEASLCGCGVKLIKEDGSIVDYPVETLEELNSRLKESDKQLEDFIQFTQL